MAFHRFGEAFLKIKIGEQSGILPRDAETAFADGLLESCEFWRVVHGFLPEWLE
jgi:hypothetical protein